MTYIQLAHKKAEFLDELFALAVKHNWYNEVAVNCQQLAEYSLKAAFENNLSMDSSDNDLKLLDGHKLVPLARRLNVIYGNVFNTDDCSILQEYYFNARYPGEDFINVSQYDAEHAVEAAVQIYKTVLGLLR